MHPTVDPTVVVPSVVVGMVSQHSTFRSQSLVGSASVVIVRSDSVIVDGDSGIVDGDPGLSHGWSVSRPISDSKEFGHVMPSQ